MSSTISQSPPPPSSSLLASTDSAENFNHTFTREAPTQNVHNKDADENVKNGTTTIISNELIVVLLVITVTAVVIFLFVYIVRVCKNSRTEGPSRNPQARPLPRLPTHYEEIRTDMRVEISQQQRLIQDSMAYETPIPSVHRRFLSDVELLPSPPPLPMDHLVQMSGDNDGYELPLLRCQTLPNLTVHGIKKKTIKRVRFADLESARNSFRSVSGESVPEIIQGPVIVEKNLETGIYVTSTKITISSRRRTQNSSK